MKRARSEEKDVKKDWFETLGDALSVAVPVVVITWLVLEKNYLEASKFGFAYLIANLITHLLKALTFAPRPYERQGEWIKWDISFKTGNSFPSGHTTSAMCGAVYASYALQAMPSLAFTGMAILVALSRVHVKAHFYRDVFYGYVIAQLTVSVIYANAFGCANWIERLFS